MTAVVVTGASGFIGRCVVRALRQAGHQVVPLDHSRGDVAHAGYWQDLPAAGHVIHLAGRSYVPESWRAPTDFVGTNVQGAARAADYCRATRAHLVFASGYLYGNPKALPVSEDHPIEPSNPYALSKMLAEQVCAFHARTEGLPVTIVRPFNIFGPGQRAEFLIPSLLKQIKRGADIRVTDLAPRRDYLFVDDFADGIARTLECPDRLRFFNFGSGVSYSVREVFDIALYAAGSDLPVISSDEQRPGEIPDVRADISVAGRLLAWKPRTSLREGIGCCLDHAVGSFETRIQQ